MRIEWSARALVDLDRFALFLEGQYPQLAKIVAAEIIDKAQVLLRHPQLGRLIYDRDEYREVMLQVLNATYIFRYAYDGERLVMPRVFHSREAR